MNAKQHAEAAEKTIKAIVEASIQVAVKEDDVLFKTLEFCRRECQFEMTLIGTRITWLLATQAFLVTASVIALSNALNPTMVYGVWLAAISWMIAVVGLVISYRSIDALDRARCTLDLWHGRIKLLFEAAQKAGGTRTDCIFLGRWVEPNEPFHQESLRLPNVILPRVFICFWVVLLLVSGLFSIRLFLSQCKILP